MTQSLPISLEDVARYPLPGMSFPIHFAFSPDGSLVTFLESQPGSLVRQLTAYDPETGRRWQYVNLAGEGATEENISREEKLRRERLRRVDLGVTDYAWSKQGALLLPFPDGIYVQDPDPSAPRKLIGTDAGPLLDPTFSPTGEWIAYVQGGEMWVIPTSGGDPRQLTFGAADEGITHGLAEYIAQEEMGRSRGYWWSPDGQSIAFAEVDETHIPVYRIVHQGMDVTGEAAQEDHRYPFAGQPNAKVRLGVVALDGGEPVWMDLGPERDIYLARVDWLPDGRLAAQVENRIQTTLDLVYFDPQTGEPRLIHSETSEVWINLNDMFRPLKDGPHAQGGFLWASERTGFRHLYLYDAEGKLVQALTEGEWTVESVAGVDESLGIVYFLGTKDTPLELNLYAVSMEGGHIRRITPDGGQHSIVIDRDCKRLIDTNDSIDYPPRVTLRSLDTGAELAVLHEAQDPRLETLNLRTPTIVNLRNRDGVFLYGAIYRPPSAFGAGPFPTIVSVYGGPHAQMVANSWRMTIAMRAQTLARRGFLVFVLDNRGSNRRGLAFEGAIKHQMGGPEVDDQVDGVRWLEMLGMADPQKVGIYGWSYGGYMSAMCLARAPETFRCAVAGAPVSAWDGYDTHYTERYMGTPQSNPDGYRDGSVIAHAGNISGRLMLVHGLVDENVHFRHTARLINALITARKTYDLLLFPDERHLPRKLADRVFMEEQILAFFEKQLK
jgi:dipeptidyl-peptidase 4